MDTTRRAPQEVDMPLDRTVIGARMSVRRRVPGETGPTGGPAMTDVIGRVVTVDGYTATIERRDGSLVDVRLDDIVSARQVPDGPKRARTRPAADFTAAELAQITGRGWPPLEAQPLGDWLLRAASGFTSRANSVGVHGEPGVSFDEALERVGSFYAKRRLPPKAQVIEGTSWSRRFAEADWRGIGGTHDHAVVQVADLREALAFTGQVSPEIVVADSVADDWLEMYNRAASAQPDVARGVLTGPPTVGFVRLGDPLIAIGRVVVTGEWAGMSCVEVAPSHRRNGLGRKIVDASLLWASDHGADKAYLQTTRHNTAAFGLYAGYGFADHHTYRYLAPQDPPA